MSKKCRKKPPNTDFDTFLTLFLGPWGLFRHFFYTPGRKAWEDLFETFGLGRLETPVCGDCSRNAWVDVGRAQGSQINVEAALSCASILEEACVHIFHC